MVSLVEEQVCDSRIALNSFHMKNSKRHAINRMNTWQDLFLAVSKTAFGIELLLKMQKDPIWYGYPNTFPQAAG